VLVRPPASHSVGFPPTPPLPLLAQTAWMRSRPFAFLEHARAHCGPRFRLKALAHPPLVFIADPDEATAVFAAPPSVLAPGDGGRTIEPIVGRQSFMLADGETHRRGRARLARLYTAEATAHHREMIRDLAECEIASWPTATPVPLHPRLRALTLRVILATLLGEDLDERAPGLHAQLLSMLDVSNGPTLSLSTTRHLPVVRGQWQRFLRERDAIDAALQHLIEERRRNGDRSQDGLGVLLASRDEHGEPLAAEHVRDSLMSLILAGHETTSAELAWSFQLIAHHPHVQRALHDELDRDAAVPYLTATIQEALRHRPVFLFAIPRAVKQPIEIGGWTHTPPSHLLVCLYLLHHDPALFADPQSFLPERFLDAEPNSAAWLPWGGGRKRCLGWRLAFLELHEIVTAALARFTLEPASAAPERPRWRSVIVTPHRGCRVVLRERRGRA